MSSYKLSIKVTPLLNPLEVYMVSSQAKQFIIKYDKSDFCEFKVDQLSVLILKFQDQEIYQVDLKKNVEKMIVHKFSDKINLNEK